MNLPTSVSNIRSEQGLRLYSYDDDTVHPCEASHWKGLIMDDNGSVVARSYPWSPTHVLNKPSDLPEHLNYSPLYEATIIRFYKHNGECMVSTHSQIDIKDKKSRVGTGRTFMELIDQAIKEWSYSEEEYTTQDGGKGFAWVPKSWRDLCQDGVVHVFLLIDESNQITDLHNLDDVYEHGDGGDSFRGPYLLHSLSLYNTDDGFVPVSANGRVIASSGDEEYSEFSFILPSVPHLTRDEAMDFVTDGGAVIGSDYHRPDMTTKFISPEYSDKLMAAGETFNPVHRWHELMDSDTRLAEYYLTILPHHKKGLTSKDMYDTHHQHLEISTSYMADMALKWLRRQNEWMPDRMAHYRLDENHSVVTLVRSVVNNIRGKYPGHKRPKKKTLEDEVHRTIAEFVMDLPYAKQHSLHGRVAKAKAGFM